MSHPGPKAQKAPRRVVSVWSTVVSLVLLGALPMPASGLGARDDDPIAQTQAAVAIAVDNGMDLVASAQSALAAESRDEHARTEGRRRIRMVAPSAHERTVSATPNREPHTIVQQAAGAASSLAAALNTGSTGNVATWGSDADGQQAGAGSSSVRTAAGVVPGARRIFAGDSFFSTLYPDGSVVAWGTSCYGALGAGYGSGYCRQGPRVAIARNVVTLASGRDHSLYVSSSGTVSAFGASSKGALGPNHFGGSVAYSGVAVPNVGNAVDAAASGQSSYILSSDGIVRAFGDNDRGQLGYPTTSASNPTPAAVVGLTNVTDVSSYQGVGYALRADGSVWDWGAGDSVARPVEGLNDVVKLAESSYNGGQAFAIRGDGSAWAWTRGSAPTQVAGLSDVRVISHSWDNMAAVLGDGRVMTSGPNSDGQLGDGTHADSFEPVRAFDVSGAVDVAVSGAAMATVADIPVPEGAPLSIAEMYGGSNPSMACVCGQAMRADPINTAYGTFHQTFTDLTLEGRGPTFRAERTYDSGASARLGVFGYGWSWAYGMHVIPSSEGATVVQENGSSAIFTGGPGGYVADGKTLATLMKVSTGWVFTRKNRERFLFDDQGRLKTVYDRNGHTINIAYSGASALVIADAAGRSVTVTLDDGLVSEISLNGSAPLLRWTYEYNAHQELTRVVDPSGGIRTHVYDDAHRMTRHVSPANQTTQSATVNVYDEHGRVTAQTSPAGRLTQFIYSGLPNENQPFSVVTVAANGSRTLDQYDANGLRSAEIRAAGTASAVTRKYTYDRKTWALAAVCVGSTCETMTYNGDGLPLTHTTPRRRTTRWQYSGNGDIQSETTPSGRQVLWNHDFAGNLNWRAQLLKSASGGGVYAFTFYQYDAEKNLTEVRNPEGHATRYEYDSAGLVVSRRDPATPDNPDGNVWRYSHDLRGALLSITAPKGNLAGAPAGSYTSHNVYDRLGRLSEVRDAKWSGGTAHRERYERDDDGRLTRIEGADGAATALAYDPDGLRLTESSDGRGTITSSYDAIGQLEYREDGLGRRTTFGYDGRGNLTEVEGPGRSQGFEYDQNDRLIEKRSGVGECETAEVNCTSYEYDRDGLLTEVGHPGSAAVGSTSIEYDLDGRRTGMTDVTGRWEWEWDSFGRLVRARSGTGQVAKYRYDLNDRVTAVTYPGGGEVVRAYTAAGQMSSTTDWLGNTTRFEYDQNGNLAHQRNPASNAVTTTFTYDAADSPTGIEHARDDVVLLGFLYGRDGASRLQTATEKMGSVTAAKTFTYSAASQLTAVSDNVNGSDALEYDADGQLLRHRAQGRIAYDADGQMCWSRVQPVQTSDCASPPQGATTYQYDEHGNRTAALFSGGSSRSFEYDEESRLTAVINGSSVVRYRFDGDGLLAGRKPYNGAWQHWFWDTSGGEAKLLTDGEASYIYGPAGRVVAQVKGNAVEYLHQDQLGSTRGITSSTGEVLATFNYAAYGRVTKTGSGTTSIGFAGQHTDSSTGLVYMRARHYDPGTGQFMTRDPLENVTGDAYGYAAGDPIGNRDTTGTFAIALAPWAGRALAPLVARAGAALGKAAVAGVGGALLGHGFEEARRRAEGANGDFGDNVPVPAPAGTSVPDLWGVGPLDCPVPGWFRDRESEGWRPKSKDESLRPDFGGKDHEQPHWDYDGPAGRHWVIPGPNGNIWIPKPKKKKKK